MLSTRYDIMLYNSYQGICLISSELTDSSKVYILNTPNAKPYNTNKVCEIFKISIRALYLDPSKSINILN